MWLFLWLIDKTTSEEVTDGERWGLVLYGKALTAQQIAASLFVNERTIRRNLTQLENGGYIRTQKKANGYAIYVRKSVKWLNRQTQSQLSAARRYPARENAIDRLMRWEGES